MSRPIVAHPLTFLAPAPIVAQSGVLRLTNFVPNGINQFGARGSLIIALSQPALPPTYFRATFKLLIGGGNGADGFSFSYGDLPAGAIGELGSGRGLRVCWRTHNTNAIEVWYGESLLHASSPPGGASLRGDEFVEASIEYLPTGLSVSHAGHAYVAALPIGEWEPRRGWRFGLGARIGADTDDHHVDDFVLEGGSAVHPQAVPLEVTLNGLQFSEEGLQYTYQQEGRSQAVGST